jgi:hypothetical protein
LLSDWCCAYLKREANKATLAALISEVDAAA